MAMIQIDDSKIPLIRTKPFSQVRTSAPVEGVDVFEVLNVPMTTIGDLDNSVNPTAAGTYKFGWVVVDLGADYADYDRFNVGIPKFKLGTNSAISDVLYMSSVGNVRWCTSPTDLATLRNFTLSYNTFPALLALPTNGLSSVTGYTQNSATGVTGSYQSIGQAQTLARAGSITSAASALVVQSRYFAMPYGVVSGKNTISGSTEIVVDIVKWK